MQADRISYRKTILAALAAALLGAALMLSPAAWMPSWFPERFANLFVVLGGVGVALGASVAVAGLVVTYRDRLLERAEVDLFERLNASRSESRLAPRAEPGRRGSKVARLLRQRMGAPPFVVGDDVRVRPLPEILATLDGEGRLNGLPFMPEMTSFCGRIARVFRCVDKVYDYGGRKNLRRMTNVVLLTGLRCDGNAHGGCQAGCYLLWHTAWLENPDVRRDLAGPPGVDTDGMAQLLRHTRRSDARDERFVCQYTEIVTGSQPMRSRDYRQDLRPLIAGNVTAPAFLIAALTRWFILVQRLRRGVGFPTMPDAAGDRPSRVDLDLAAGDLVEVLDPVSIAATLDRRSRHRGLWWDREMLKHCGRRYRVRARVERIIDDATGRMVRMKTPCVVLEGLSSSGEFLRFCAQHDLPFWREAWLKRLDTRESGEASRAIAKFCAR